MHISFSTQLVPWVIGRARTEHNKFSFSDAVLFNHVTLSRLSAIGLDIESQTIVKRSLCT